MIFRLGYVAMTLNLKDCSPSGTVTLSNLNKLKDRDAILYELRRVAAKNLENTLRILKYNKALDIDVYRLTSKLIPLATHPETSDWDYNAEFKDKFRLIGQFIKENEFRISAHPDHFTLLNSENPKVHEDSIKDLDYHIKVFEAMGLEADRYKLVIHVGGLYKDKTLSISRFIKNFTSLPERFQERIMLENDDKSYSAADVAGICKELSIPMVLDIHHHNCINNGEPLEEVLGLAFETWRKEEFPPKVHFSSPKSQKQFRSHADDIDTEEFIEFLEAARKFNQDFDVMLEAKNKDSALLKLSSDLSRYGHVECISNGKFRL